MSATSGGGGSVSEGSEAGGSSQSTMSIGDSPSTSFQANLGSENVTKITLSEDDIPGSFGTDMTGSKINLSLDERQPKDGIVNVAFDYEEEGSRGGLGIGSMSISGSAAGVSIGGGGMSSAGAGMGIGGNGATTGTNGSNASMGISGSSASLGVNGSSASMGVNGSSASMGISSGGAGVGSGGSGGISSSGGGADFRSINVSDKKDKVPEAVNLELVNMVPYSNGNGTSYGVPVNGIPMKKDSEQVDMSTPYDEYFVPVNEHKKYMRGEKLYVTKDKRRPTSWRRCLSWIVACTVISVVLILAILAGTGVILSQEPNLVKEASVGRNFAGSNLKPSVTSKSSTPTAEMYIYVPRSIESEFVIDNLDFDPALKDVKSTAYQQFAANMEDQLKMLLFDKESLEFGASDIGLKVVNVSGDPFKVNYRIGWNYKKGVNNPPEPIKMEDVKKRLVESLTRNQGYIDKYHIDREAIKVNHVINTCQMDNGGCSHICYYNYHTQRFVCTCPTHLVLDNTGKNCVAWTGSSEDDALPVPNRPAYPGLPVESTGNPAQEKEIDAIYEHGLQGQHQDQHDHSSHHESGGHGEYGENEPTAEPSLEPAAEPSPSFTDGSSGHEQNIHAYDSDQEAAAEPDSKKNFNSYHSGHDDSDHGHSDHDMHSTYDSKEPATELEPTAEPNSNDKDHAHYVPGYKEEEPSAEPTPEPAPEPTGDNSQGRGHNYDESDSLYGFKDREPESKPTPQSAQESSSENKDQNHLFMFGSKDGEHLAEPTPEPTAEPNPESKDNDYSGYSVFKESETEPAAEPTPEPTASGDSKVKDYDHTDQYGSKDHELTATSEPTLAGESNDKNPEHSGHTIYESKEHEPSAEPTPEPTSTGDSNDKNPEHSGHTIYESKEHEPSAEPTPEPISTGDSNDKNQEHSGHSIYESKDHEPSAEPTPETTSTGDSNDKNQEHSGHTIYESKEHEPSAEPTPEPTSTGDSNDKNQEHSGHSIYESKDHEPSAEPTPEPISTGDSNDKNQEHSGHSIYESKDHEPAAEPTPEPTSTGDPNEKNQNYSGHSIYESKEHEPSAEPTVTGDFSEKNQGHSVYESKDHESEPTPEPSAGSDVSIKEHELEGHSGSRDHEPATELTATGDLGEKNQDHSIYEPKNPESPPESISETPITGDTIKKDTAHSVSGSKDQEPGAEPTPEPAANYDSSGKVHKSIAPITHESKNQEHKKESTTESTPEGNDKDQGTHSVIVSKDKEAEPQPTPEPGFDTNQESKMYSSQEIESLPKLKTENNEPQPIPEPSPEGDANSGTGEHTGTTIHPIHGQDHSGQVVQSQEQTRQTDVGIQKNNEDNSEKEKSMHHLPHLEDVLIRRPTLNSENATGHGQNPLDNVERLENGKPVIEEIIIDKPVKKSDETVMSGHSGIESERNEGTTESFNNKDNAMGESNDNSTKQSVLLTEHGSDTNNHRDTLHEIAVPTVFPKIVEYTTKVNSRDTDKSGTGQTEYPNYESATKSHDQDPFGYFNTGVVNQPDQARASINPSQDNTPATTVHSDIQHEYHTIPVSVELAEGANHKTKSKQEGNIEIPGTTIRLQDSSITNSGVLMGSEGPSSKETDRVSSDESKSQILSKEGTQPQETATESQVTSTTLFTILTPEGVEKITSRLAKGSGSSVTELEDKAINVRKSQQEGIETTKSPEEISNNIKDELSENEEFNILIDEKYKNKDGNTGEGKETISKYPNKSLKTEKKKIKDYVKNIDKIDPEKRGEVTPKPEGTTEDFILQKHVNGNEPPYDLEFSLQNEHTTKHDGGVTITYPHANDGVPGVSFKPHGINNHDLSVLQTVAPDFRTETIFPTGVQELEILKPDSKNKFPDSKEGEFKADKDHPKFDKDYKYDKQKVSKKKDLKKKIGGKDGKNVELEDGRKYFTEISKEDLDVSNEEGKENQEATMNPSFENITVQPEVRSEFGGVTTVPQYKVREDPETTDYNAEARTQIYTVGVTELPGIKSADRFKVSEQTTSGNHQQNLSSTSVYEKGHLTIDEPTVKSTSNLSPGTVYDEQLVKHNNAGMTQAILNFTNGEHRTPGTVFDGIPHTTTGGNTTFVLYQTTDSLPKIVSDGKSESFAVNSTTAHPTIIIHGQSGNLQDGQTIRFGNSTFFNTGNATVVSIFNGTLTHPEGHSFSFTNYTATFPNGSAVHPTIIVRGQSGTLQDGHQTRFGNTTHQSFVTTSAHPGSVKSSNVYRIENETLPGTVFDGHFNPLNGHYHMYTNSSGTFVYTNATTQPAFIIKGDSGDFGNSTVYILRNNNFSSGFVGPQSVVFRNSTVFAVENGTPGAGGVQEITVHPHKVSNETIAFTNQMSPSFVSSGTAYKVNDYFGYISKCAAGQFQCVNGTSKRGSACIDLSSKCDSIPDCSDGSDELGCIENGCPGNFQCSDGTCLKRNLVCNGILDCSDHSDEKNCESWKCEFDEFQCPSGRCIPVVWQCDGKPDCDNHTDEHNCQTSCGNDEYLCPEGWCIPLTYKCNGVKECSNGEDEQLCDCSHDEFKCNTGGCVSMKNVCDGLDDCPDRSDEWDCVKLEPESNLLKIRSPSGDYSPVCTDNWSSQYSDEVCASLGYFSSVPIENENGSSITTDSSFYVLKNDTTVDFNKKIIVNLRKGDGKCSSGKLVEISCQEFSCGSRSMTDSSSVEARLVGGMSAASGQWPSVALLYNVRNLHSCTANVLTPRWVLASYNCLKMGNKNLNEQDWKFFGGSTVFETEKENAETRKILRIIPHPQLKFNQFLFTNDLALVELDQSLLFTSNLGAVCLPEQEIQPRQICVTAGWGMNAPEDKAIKQQLQYLPVPTMNLTECNSTEHYSGFITDDKICAGYNSAQKSLCYNEEGAPLMCVNDAGEWELQGVLSYHSNCGRGSHPSIFSSITPVKNWIKKTIGNSFERNALPVTKR